MNINVELLGIIVGIIFQGLYIAHRMGKFEAKLDCIEQKQDKHNNLIERMVRVEDNTNALKNTVTEIQDNCHKVLRDRLKNNE